MSGVTRCAKTGLHHMVWGRVGPHLFETLHLSLDHSLNTWSKLLSMRTALPVYEHCLGLDGKQIPIERGPANLLFHDSVTLSTPDWWLKQSIAYTMPRGIRTGSTLNLGKFLGNKSKSTANRYTAIEHDQSISNAWPNTGAKSPDPHGVVPN